MEIALIITSTIVLIVIITIILYLVLRSPFIYPYFRYSFDVSRKRSPDINDYLDNYLIQYGITDLLSHNKSVEQWKEQSKQKVEQSKLKRYRQSQFEKAIDDKHMFQFSFLRNQTRYKQRNYHKHSYIVTVTIAKYAFDLSSLQQRYEALKQINFECTLKEYNARDQRKIMTKALRDEIAKRDNYTCQMCGKYMPDGVGLHIDHIIPIAKGGKSVPSNLQVLCSKCNGKKSKK